MSILTFDFLVFFLEDAISYPQQTRIHGLELFSSGENTT